MKTIKTILFLILLSVICLSSCNQNQQKPTCCISPFGISPINLILKMSPVKITIAHWIEVEKEMPKLKMETEQEFIEAVKNPENWIGDFETTYVNQINMIMTALNKPPVEKAIGMPGTMVSENKICFEDTKGNIKWTVFVILPDEKKIYFPDKVYGEETYNTFAKILNIRTVQDANQSEQKPSE